MGQNLSAVVNNEADPKLLIMRLRCDGDHGLLDGERKSIMGPDYICMRKQASDLGWRRVHGGKWLGPCCAKVKAKSENE